MKHVVTEEMLEGAVQYHRLSLFQATTVDRTQSKLLYKKGANYLVIRRYFVPGSLVLERDETVVYEGPDAAEAVRMYNGLG